MASLITTDEFDEIRSAIGDVTDTFLQKSISYIKAGVTLERMNKDRDGQKRTSYSIPGLIVWEKNNADAMITPKRQGSFDYSKGYALFNMKDVQAELITDSKFNGNPEADYVSFDNQEYKIEGINMIGQLPTDELLVKIHFRKQLKDG